MGGGIRWFWGCIAFFHDDGGGTAPHPLVWSAGALPKRRRLVHAVPDRAFLPGSGTSGSLSGLLYLLHLLLLRMLKFGPTLLGSWSNGFLSWALCTGAGERLFLEKAVLRYWRPGRPIPVSAVLFGPGIDMCRPCRFIGSLFRSLCALPGGIGRFVLCDIGVNQCWL